MGLLIMQAEDMHKRSLFVKLVFLLVAVMSLYATGSQLARAGGGVLFATPDGSESADCQSWSTACSLPRLSPRLLMGNEIWVKKGTHYPGYSQVDTFLLKSGVTILGGFYGNESLRDQRDWVANLTALSGDVDRNDINAVSNHPSGTASPSTNTNALHVVTVDQTCRARHPGTASPSPPGTLPVKAGLACIAATAPT